jgi:hypothetical protein
MAPREPLSSGMPLQKAISQMTAPPDVIVVDGVYHLQFAPGQILPFQQNGGPLRDLGAGWSYHSLYAEFAPILLFELQHVSGARATWFFDSTPQFLGHTAFGIPEFHHRILLHKASVLFDRMVGTVTGGGQTSTLAEVQSFFQISQAARQELEHLCRPPPASIPHIATLSELSEQIISMPKGIAGPLVIVHRQALATSLTTSFQDRLMKGLIDGTFSWPSPVDGTDQPCSGGLCFNLFHFAYRISDPESGLVYFLLVSEHASRLLGQYYPSENLIITVDEWSKKSLETCFPDILTSIRIYICRFGDTFIPYQLRYGPKTLANSMRESHLGHQLWNEFSGLEDIVASIPAELYPIQLSYGGPIYGTFGPLADIFPEFASKTRTDVSSERDIIEFANRHDLILARFTRIFVSEALRNRMLRYAATTSDFQAARAQYRPGQGPVILIGLRVENRTVVDLASFICNLVSHIAQIAPGSTIVLDGQNRRFDQRPVGSFSDHLAKHSPIDVEADLCQQVIASAAGQPVTVVSTSGQTIANSLGWITCVDCFIAIWGAGLVKYRWIGNKPGLVLSSQFHLLNPQEMSIYHTPQMMENPTPVHYADPASVEDQADAQQLVPVDGLRHISFRVNEPVFFAQVDAFLAPFIQQAMSQAS